jgi:MFS family permease
MKDKRELWFYSYLPTNMAGGCFDTLLPVFIVVALGGTVADVALISMAASAASVPALIFWGLATDKMRWRKHFIIAGFLGRVVSYTLMGAAVGASHILFANILMGILSSASAPAMSILIFEYFSKDQWSEKIGLFNKIAGIGALIGIALGTVWVAVAPMWMDIGLALRLLFLLNAVLALVGAWLAFILIAEPDEKLARERFLSHAVQLMRWAYERAKYFPGKMYYFFKPSHLRQLDLLEKAKRSFIGWFLVATFTYNIGAVAFFTIQPVFLIKVIGIDSTVVFALSFTQALVSTLLYRSVGKVLDKADKTKFLLGAKLCRTGLFSFYAASVIFVTWSGSTNLAFLIVMHVTFGITWAFIADTQLPIAISESPEEKKGAHAGTFNAIVGLGAIAGAAFGGIVAISFDLTLAIIASAMLIGLSSVILWVSVTLKDRAVAQADYVE